MASSILKPAGAMRGDKWRLFLRNIVRIKPGEGRALLWSWLYIFSLFLAYYMLRPIREELGVAGGVKNLPWLFTGIVHTFRSTYLLGIAIFILCYSSFTRGPL